MRDKWFPAFAVAMLAWCVGIAVLNSASGDVVWAVVNGACALVWAYVLYQMCDPWQ